MEGKALRSALAAMAVLAVAACGPLHGASPSASGAATPTPFSPSAAVSATPAAAPSGQPAAQAIPPAALTTVAQQTYRAASSGGIQPCDHSHGPPDPTNCPFTARLEQRVAAVAQAYPDSDAVCACQTPPDSIAVTPSGPTTVQVAFLYAGVSQASATLTAVQDAAGHVQVDDITFATSTCHADIYDDPFCHA